MRSPGLRVFTKGDWLDMVTPDKARKQDAFTPCKSRLGVRLFVFQPYGLRIPNSSGENLLKPASCTNQEEVER